MNQDEYNTKRDYFIKYVNRLLPKRHVVKRRMLEKIKYNLKTIGHLKTKHEYNFLLTFLNHDHDLKHININMELRSLEQFQNQPTTFNLEEFMK